MHVCAPSCAPPVTTTTRCSRRFIPRIPSATASGIDASRRSGTPWFLAVLCGPASKAIRVPLSFLGGGLLVQRHAIVVSGLADGIAQGAALQKSPSARDPRFQFLQCRRSLRHAVCSCLRSHEPARSLHCCAAMKARDVARLLLDRGWYEIRTVGSHRHFGHATRSGTVTLAGRPGADIPTGTLRSIFRQAGIDWKDRRP